MRTSNPILVTTVAAVCFGSLGAARASESSSRNKLTPANLRCEYLVNPLGIGVTEPRLSWTLQSEERAQVQTAYRIPVASAPEFLSDGRGALWDSGRVTSSRSIQVVYGGRPLTS